MLRRRTASFNLADLEVPAHTEKRPVCDDVRRPFCHRDAVVVACPTGISLLSRCLASPIPLHALDRSNLRAEEGQSRINLVTPGVDDTGNDRGRRCLPVFAEKALGILWSDLAIPLFLSHATSGPWKSWTHDLGDKEGWGEQGLSERIVRLIF